MLWIPEFRNPDMFRACCFPLVLPKLWLLQSSGHSILRWSLSWSLLQFTVFAIGHGCLWTPSNLESYPAPLNTMRTSQQEGNFFVSVNLISTWPVCDRFSNEVLLSSSCRKPISMASLYCSVDLWFTLHLPLGILVSSIWLLGRA